MFLLIIPAGIVYTETEDLDPVVLNQLAQVRRITAKYHNVNIAIVGGIWKSLVLYKNRKFAS